MPPPRVDVTNQNPRWCNVFPSKKRGFRGVLKIS